MLQALEQQQIEVLSMLNKGNVKRLVSGLDSG
jgi:hypothetical protein